jgi:hypothetical protein
LEACTCQDDPCARSCPREKQSACQDYDSDFNALRLSTINDEEIDLLCYVLFNVLPTCVLTDLKCDYYDELNELLCKEGRRIQSAQPQRLQSVAWDLKNLPSVAHQFGFPIDLLSSTARGQVQHLASSAPMGMAFVSSVPNAWNTSQVTVEEVGASASGHCGASEHVIRDASPKAGPMAALEYVGVTPTNDDVCFAYSVRAAPAEIDLAALRRRTLARRAEVDGTTPQHEMLAIGGADGSTPGAAVGATATVGNGAPTRADVGGAAGVEEKAQASKEEKLHAPEVFDVDGFKSDKEIDKTDYANVMAEAEKAAEAIRKELAMLDGATCM